VTDEDGRGWHDHPGVTWAAGAAAVGLVGLLVFAVLRMSDGAHPGGVALPATSAASTTPASHQRTSTTTTYTVPSVQTSEATGPEVTGPPQEASTADAPDDATSTTSTTIYNPYVTTTPPAAGHV
jgi:cytoskeletal protein RodZ